MLKEGYLKTHSERTRKKNSIRTNTYKLLTKARENIEATESGMFGVGHERKLKVKGRENR